MRNFQENFAELQPNGTYIFSNAREGTIVGLVSLSRFIYGRNNYLQISLQLSIGTLVGALINGPLADFLGRRFAIVFWNIIFIVGVIVQIASTQGKWVQIAVGRLVAGFGVGALSVLTPMYQSETAPKQIRGALVRYVYWSSHIEKTSSMANI